jgi:SAM-dependent MidA family methyltransferase
MQGRFLASMGIVERVVGLIEDEKTTDEESEDLYSALERLIVPEQMCERYKVLDIARKKDVIFAPPGF